MQVNQIFQAAYVVDNLEEAMDKWRRVANGCLGPFFVMRECRPDTFTYHGKVKESELLADIAFAQAGKVNIELIQPRSSGPDFYRETAPLGGTGYHHQAYFSDDLDAEKARFAAMGVEIGAEGQFGTLRYIYFDTRPLIGCVTEVFARDAAMEGLFKTIADAAIDWDGTDPVRLVG